MKKLTSVFLVFAVLAAILFINIFAVNSFDTTANPYDTTLPASGYGGNKIRQVDSGSLQGSSANSSSKYCWKNLSGSNDVIVACNSVKIKAKLTIMAITDYHLATGTRTTTFYGYNLPTTQASYYTVLPCSASAADTIIEADFDFKTTVIDPVTQNVILTSNAPTHTLP